MTPNLIDFEAWMAKLAAWAADDAIGPDHPALSLALDQLKETLGGLDERQGRELSIAFAHAFKLPEDSIWELVDEEPKLAAPEERRIVPPAPVHGLVKRYVRWLKDQESPDQYHAFCFLTAISAAMRRRAVFSLSGIQIYPNLYTILVGPSGARKDSAFDYALNVVVEAAPDMNVLAGEGSQQGFAEQLVTRCENTGVADGLIPAPELKVLFGKDSYKEELVAWLTEWYKCSAFWSRALRSSGTMELRNIYVCLLGGTTEDWLKRMPEDTLAGGFLQARALVIPASDKKHWRFLPYIDLDERARIVNELAGALQDVPPVVKLGEKARKRFTEWYEKELPQTCKGQEERMQAYFQRIHVHALKFAAIMTTLEGYGEIQLDVAQAAIALSEWCGQVAAPLLNELEVREPIYDDVMSRIRRAGGRMPTRDLVRMLRNKYPARLIQEAKEQLLYSQDLEKGLSGGLEVVKLAKTKKRDVC